MISPLRRAGQVGAGRVAATCGEVSLTYAEMWDRCRRLAGALRGIGVERGDRVAVVSTNCHRYLEVYQAVPGAGMVIVPLNQRHTDAGLAYALEDAAAPGLFPPPRPEGLPPCVEHVIDLGEGYERLLADAADVDPGAPAPP